MPTTTTTVTPEDLAEALATPCDPTDHLTARGHGWPHALLIDLTYQYDPLPQGTYWPRLRR